MSAMKLMRKAASAIACLAILPTTPARAEEPEAPRPPFVRIAELEIDPARLQDFHAAVRESIETSVRVEPQVLALYAVADQLHPTRITVFEIYTDAKAYDRHRETAHFQKFFQSTQAMVKSRRLIDTVPIAMQAKPLPR